VEALQIVINAVVVGAVGAILTFMTHGVRREVGELRRELKGDIGNLRTELKGDIAELRVEMREMRSDLTRVALAVGAERRAENR
jgi:hypothetical protein